MANESSGARRLIAVLAFVLGIGIVPHRICERDASAYFDGEPARIEALARGVERWTRRPLGPDAFSTGSARFDGEWRLATYAMAAVAFAQIAQERGGAGASRMEPCLEALLDPAARAFDREAWGEGPLGGDRGHVGFLGYAGLAFALHRALVPASRFVAREVEISAALERRFAKGGLVETYPGETYPVDNAAGLAALAVHAHRSGAPSRGLARGLEAMRARGVDPTTGLLFQALGGAPRGSGTALAAYFLSYADPPLAASLYRALRRELFRTVLGFGAVLEHPSGASRGDVDSGPVVFGFGVSATGFALGASRARGDAEAFRALYATAHLFGVPIDRDGARSFATGGPIGDAILLAMLTAPRSDP